MKATRIVITEWIVWAISIGCLITGMPLLLISGDTTLPHDNFNSYFPAFQFFLDNIYSGEFPLWNPFSHGGEPFYPILLQERLLEPLTWVNAFLLKTFITDYVLLHNWNRFLQSLFMLLGMYLVLRRYTSYILTRVILILTLSFSSTMLGSFQQEGIIHQFLWVPYVVYLLQNIFERGDRRWRNYIFLGIATGVNFQSYLFAGVSLFYLFLCFGVLTQKSPRSIRIDKRLLASLVTAMLMMGPNIAVFLERDDYVFPMRMFSEEFGREQTVSGPMQWEGAPADIRSPLIMAYELNWRTGSTSTIWDFLQLIVPGANPIIHGSKRAWGDPSEAFLYLGVFVYFVGLFGFFFTKNRNSRIWKVSLLGWGLITLGVGGGLHRLLFPIFPPLWVMRNTHCLVLFFQFCLLYFFCHGLESLLSSRLELKLSNRRLPLVFASTLLLLCLLKWSLELDFNQIPWMPGAVILAAILLTGLYYLAGVSEAFLSVAITHLIAAIFYSPAPRALLFAFWTFALFAPIFGVFTHHLAKRMRLEILQRAAGVLIFISIAGDLSYHFYLTQPLLQLQPHPKKYLNTEATFRTPTYPGTREIIEYYPKFALKTDPPIQQIPRYMSLLNRKAYALSPIYEWKERIPKEGFQGALESRRWNSFLLLKSYFDLLHSGQPYTSLENSFAIQEPLFQLRKGDGHSHSTDVVETPAPDGGVIKLQSYAYSSMGIAVTALDNLYLYYSDAHHRHWRATVDGTETPIILANQHFKAIPITKGHHVIELQYRPRLFIAGTILFLGTIVVAVIGLWCLWFRETVLVYLNFGVPAVEDF